jgi:uncharacterized protein YjiS (DUF1127 family)
MGFAAASGDKNAPRSSLAVLFALFFLRIRKHRRARSRLIRAHPAELSDHLLADIGIERTYGSWTRAGGKRLVLNARSDGEGLFT